MHGIIMTTRAITNNKLIMPLKLRVVELAEDRLDPPGLDVLGVNVMMLGKLVPSFVVTVRLSESELVLVE